MRKILSRESQISSFCYILAPRFYESLNFLMKMKLCSKCLQFSHIKTINVLCC